MFKITYVFKIILAEGLTVFVNRKGECFTVDTREPLPDPCLVRRQRSRKKYGKVIPKNQRRDCIAHTGRNSGHSLRRKSRKQRKRFWSKAKNRSGGRKAYIAEFNLPRQRQLANAIREFEEASLHALYAEIEDDIDIGLIRQSKDVDAIRKMLEDDFRFDDCLIHDLCLTPDSKNAACEEDFDMDQLPSPEDFDYEGYLWDLLGAARGEGQFYQEDIQEVLEETFPLGNGAIETDDLDSQGMHVMEL